MIHTFKHRITKRAFKSLSLLVYFFRYVYEMIFSLFEKSIRISFTNFWPNLNPWFFLKPFKNSSRKYRIVKAYRPHIQFFSVFGEIKKLEKAKAGVKIFYTGENVNKAPYTVYEGNCIDKVSLSLGFDYGNAENYLRFPIWLLYYFSPDNSKDDIRVILNGFKKHRNKTKFCALVSRHDKGGLRTKMYDEISKIANIDCPGKILHNDDTLQNLYNDDKILYLQQYKFNICPENSKSQGYVTEKIFQSLSSGCIPIYSGWSKDPEPGIINPNVIMWYDESDEENNRYLMSEIKKLHENDKLFLSFSEQPYFCDTAVDKIYDYLYSFHTKISELFDTVNIRN